MKNILLLLKVKYLVFLLCLGILCSCNDDLLNEKPKSFFNPEAILVNKAGFETSLVAIHSIIRDGYFKTDNMTNSFFAFHEGTDVNMTFGASYIDYNQTVTPTMPQAQYMWDFAYANILPRANMIISYAEKPVAKWTSEQEKNEIVAEARFFRAYAHNLLANLFGGVPISDQFYTEPKLDFVRATREDVYKFIAADLEFASKWLPVKSSIDGRIVKAAADHLLTEVYISLGRYDDAVRSASDVIDSGNYKLMTERFGSSKDASGDVFSDLFKEKNQNRNSGNTETIWALQIEYNVPGGGVYRGTRYWNSQYYGIKDPDGVDAIILCDSLGRPNGWSRGTPHVYYGVWGDRKDMRCSDHNFRWDFYVNNPKSKYWGQKVDPRTFTVDTMRTYYPTIRKLEGVFYDGSSSANIYVDQYVMRLAETYLLRAEAYLLKGDKEKAADDINVVRSRAKATPVSAKVVDMDYILDERIRELIVEEPRRLTLMRTGKLVERVRKYFTTAGHTIKDHHQLWPIPQTAIDANIEATLDQNPGY